MPQLDQYIFLHQIATLVLFFFLLYAYVRRQILPRLNSILKYRNKKIAKLWRYDKGHWRLYYRSNLFYSKTGAGFLKDTNLAVIKILLEYKNILIIKTQTLLLDSIKLNRNKENFIHSNFYLDVKRSFILCK